MGPLNAFVSSEYPVIFSLIPGGAGDAPIPEGYTGIAVALLVKGAPTFLATHLVPDDEASDVVDSLESGDVRVAIVGVPVQLGADEDEGVEGERFPGAFITVLCADGRRFTVARVIGTSRDQTPEQLARFLIKQIAQGVQITALSASG
ncbi:MAG: hypothetical protein HY704_08385 [Gemmatimonadetes bacterium]|nr:hypothetical protein [Gemmatimonadota bacterium]